MNIEELRNKILLLEAKIRDIESAEPNVIEQAKLTGPYQQRLVLYERQLDAILRPPENPSSMITILEKLSHDMSGLSHDMRDLTIKSDAIEELVKENNYLLLDPWNDLTATSIGKAAKLKADFMAHYGLTHATAFCMISGVIPPAPTPPGQPNLILAHLLPRSAKGIVLDALGMTTDDIDDFRNTILLCKGIEVAFDRKEVSIVPIDNPFVDGRYHLIFWNDKFKSRPLFNGSTTTIGSYEHHELKLNLYGHMHTVFRRVISYQAFMACRWWFRHGNRMGLPVDCDISVYDGSYQNSRRDFAQQFRKALERETGGI